MRSFKGGSQFVQDFGGLRVPVRPPCPHRAPSRAAVSVATQREQRVADVDKGLVAWVAGDLVGKLLRTRRDRLGAGGPRAGVSGFEGDSELVHDIDGRII